MRTVVRQAVIDWEAASLAASAAVRKADDLGIRINAAVVDSGGNLAAFLRMPGAFLHSIDIAIDKAYSAAGFGMATSQWKAALADHASEVGEGLARRPRMIMFGGGLPMRVEGELLGGIGVSGGTSEQDELCARTGLNAIGAQT